MTSRTPNGTKSCKVALLASHYAKLVWTSGRVMLGNFNHYLGLLLLACSYAILAYAAWSAWDNTAVVKSKLCDRVFDMHVKFHNCYPSGIRGCKRPTTCELWARVNKGNTFGKDHLDLLCQAAPIKLPKDHNTTKGLQSRLMIDSNRCSLTQ